MGVCAPGASRGTEALVGPRAQRGVCGFLHGVLLTPTGVNAWMCSCSR